MLTISKSLFGKTMDGEVHLFILKNKNGMEVKITNYGGTITSILVPDKNGNFEDVVLGFDNLKQYLEPHPYLGNIIGRYGNRIANGKFKINNETYKLTKNSGKHHLHGGTKGFDKMIWDAKKKNEADQVSLELSYLSKDMEEGYPGNLKVKITYTLTNKNELKINYEATTDKTTICNLTNHSYFNLAGAGIGDIMNHEIMIDADAYTPTTSNLIPTGEIASVKHTPFDFRKYTVIENGINTPIPQLQFGKGYDTNFVLNKKEGTLGKIASLRELNSGRVMDVFSTEPGVQFYTGNWINELKGKKGKTYSARSGVCLETQKFPNSPNHSNFPNTILSPKEIYQSTTIYQFLTTSNQDDFKITTI